MSLLAVVTTFIAAVFCGDRFATRNLQAQRVAAYPAEYVKSYVDNFDPRNSTTYSQRYYVNKDGWNNKADAPIFLEIGGEGPIKAPPSGEDEIAVLAKQHGAIVIALEHRYYGISMPFTDLSLEHLKYLDDRQALEDVVHFIDFYDEILHPDDHVAGNPKNKWVLFGGSYPGALASWIRTKYPHMSKCSVASSGVVEAIYEFTGFDGQIYDSSGEQCGNLLRLVTSKMESQVVQLSSRIALFARFGADSGYDIGDFFYYMADSGVMAIQYGHTNELCGRLISASEAGTDLIDAYEDYVMNWLNKTMNPYGADTYDRRVMSSTKMPRKEDYISRQWQYQTCARFSWFQNAPKANSVRSAKYLPFSYFLGLCKAVFQVEMDPEVANVNNYYGGKKTMAPNVFYANYWQDPWHLASPDETLDTTTGSEQVLVRCADCGHCQDMHPAKESDPAELKAVRERIGAFVDSCLVE